MREYSDEVRLLLKNGKLRCKSGDLSRLAKSCGLTYGKFMSALYQDGIEVVLDKPKRGVVKDSDKPYGFRATRDETRLAISEAMTGRQRATEEVVAYDRETGEMLAVFPTRKAASAAYGVSETIIQRAVRGEYHYTKGCKLKVGFYARLREVQDDE